MKINATSPVDKEANSTSSAMFLSSEDICAQLFDPVPLEQLLACSSPYTPTQAIFVGLLLGLLALGTAIGNLLIILAVLLVRRLRTPGNLLILNLALSDFLVSVLVLPFAIIYQLEGFWRLDQSVCTLYILADVLLCTSSILGLCAISIDRFMAINSPLDYPRRRTTCKMILMILLCWTVSALISVTPLFGWDRPDFGYQCAYNNEPTYQFYAIFSAFFLPLSVMLILYGRIFLVARRMAHKDAKQSSKWNSPTPVNFSVGMAGPFEESVWQIKNYEISKNINNLEEEEVLVQSIGHKNVDIWGFSNGSHANHLLPGKLFLLDSARFNRWLRRKTWCPVRIVQFKASPITQYESSSGMSPVMGSSSSTKSHNTLSNKEIRTNAARSKDGKVQQKNSLTMKDHSPDAVEMPTVLGLGRRHSKQTMLRLSKEEILFNGNQYNGEVSECEAESKSNPMTIRDMQTTPDEQGANSNWKPASEKSNVFRSSESDSHNKAVLTLGVIMGCFTICWLPFFTTQLMETISRSLNSKAAPLAPQWVFQIFLWLGYANSFLNPLIYAKFNREFRTPFVLILNCRCRDINHQVRCETYARQFGDSANFDDTRKFPPLGRSSPFGSILALRTSNQPSPLVVSSRKSESRIRQQAYPRAIFLLNENKTTTLDRMRFRMMFVKKPKLSLNPREESLRREARLKRREQLFAYATHNNAVLVYLMLKEDMRQADLNCEDDKANSEIKQIGDHIGTEGSCEEIVSNSITFTRKWRSSILATIDFSPVENPLNRQATPPIVKPFVNLEAGPSVDFIDDEVEDELEEKEMFIAKAIGGESISHRGCFMPTAFVNTKLQKEYELN